MCWSLEQSQCGKEWQAFSIKCHIEAGSGAKSLVEWDKMEKKIAWREEGFQGEREGRSHDTWLDVKYGQLSHKSSSVIKTTLAHITAVISATRETNWHDQKQHTRRAQHVAKHRGTLCELVFIFMTSAWQEAD